MDPALIAQAAEVLAAARVQGVGIVTAESCTGGLIAAALTEVPGSSDVFLQGNVTYANEAKMRLLGVPEAMLTQHGAVSEAVARAMAEGAQRQAHAMYGGRRVLALAVTGVAGPGGGSAAKPVGTVHLACADLAVTHRLAHFQGDRAAVRQQAAMAALSMALAALR